MGRSIELFVQHGLFTSSRFPRQMVDQKITIRTKRMLFINFQQYSMMNLIQWEQQIKFTVQEEEILASFERLEVPVPVPVDQPVNDDSLVSQLNAYLTTDQPRVDQALSQIEEVVREYQGQVLVMSALLENLGSIATQLNHLEEKNRYVVTAISQFHEQSNLFIRQQKAMIEMQNQISEYLQYYTNAEKLGHEVDTFDEVQRRMSEISDGLVFFSAHGQFNGSARMLDAYKQLRKRLIAVVKNHLFRLLNKEFAFTNSGKNRYSDVLLSLFYPCFLGAGGEVAQPNPMKLQFLQIMYPQHFPTIQLYDDDGRHVSPKNIKFDEQFEKFQLGDSLKSFCHFMEAQLDKDPEIYELFNDVFLEFRSYCRMNLHQSINDQIAKQLGSASSLGSTLNRIRAQLLEKAQHVAPEPLIFETLLAFVFEVYLNEALYFKTIFNCTTRLIEEKTQALLSQLCETYYLTIRTFIHKNNNLDVLLQCAATLKRLMGRISFTCVKPHYISETLKAITTPNANAFMQASIARFNSEILEKTRLDLMQRIIAMCHVAIQESIYNFNMKEYLKRIGKLQIHKLVPQGHQAPKHYALQKEDTFPTVVRGVALILKLGEFIDRKIFEQLAGEILREINNQVKDLADRYDLKFDSYLFFIKQLLILTESLLPLGGNFIIKEQELDFSETKTILLQLISGQLRPNIKWVELTSAEKLWSYTTNFFTFIYNGMPKLNQYEVDLKQTMVLQLKNVSFSFVKDMTFVICKNVIDFLRKYQFLQFIISAESSPEVNHTVTPEQANLDLEVLLQRETISKTYHFFIENMYEFTDEMVSKLNNYTTREMFDKIQIYLQDIIQNCISLLSQFYIVVSKHKHGSDYDSYNFKSIDEVSKTTQRKVVYVE